MSPCSATSVPLVSLHTHTDLSHCAKPDMTLDAAVALAVEHGYLREPEHEPNAMWEATDKGRVRALLELAKERGVAMEIQPALWYHPERAGRVTELIDLWLDGGGLVSLGSDAHALASLQTWAERYSEIVERFDLSAEKMWLPPSVS